MGNETDAFDCYVNENDTTNGMCYQMDDAAVDCYTNDKNGTLDITSDGRVLYTENGTTETICSYEWDDIDAGVLCRHLGLGMSGGAKYLPRDWSYNRANAYGVFCMGNETDAFDCYVNENDTTNGMCYQMDDAAVDCYTSSMPMTGFFDDKNGTLDITSDGRVLYTENGTTETICSYEWDDIDAGVLCRHLGLGMSGGAKYLPHDLSYNRANAYGVFCMGNETDAFDCYVNENDTTNGMCYQMDDAAVDCYTSSMPMTGFFDDKNGTLDITSDGRVLYTENGTTETICSYEWDDIDAGVLCRHLGLGMSGGAKYLPRDWSYNRANAYGVFCMGNETDAFDCYVNENDTTNGMCYQMDDAAVDCYTSTMPMTSFFNDKNDDKNGTLDIDSDGRVLYTENGTTETICSYEWDDIDAGVLCRHLGLGMSGGAKYLPRDWSYNRANAYGVFCMGNETDAFDCYVNENDTTNGMCYQMDDAAVECDSHMSSTSVLNTLMYSPSSVYNIQPTSMNSNMVLQSTMSILQLPSNNYVGMNPSHLTSSNYMQQSNIQPSHSTISVSRSIPIQSTNGLQQITTQFIQSNSMLPASSNYNGLSVMHPIQTTPITTAVSSINGSPLMQNSQVHAITSSITQQSMSQVIHNTQTNQAFSSIIGSPIMGNSHAPALTTSVPQQTMSHVIQNTPTIPAFSSINGSPLMQNSQVHAITSSIAKQSMSQVIHYTQTTQAFSGIVGSFVMGNSQGPALTTSILPQSISQHIQNTQTIPAFSSITGTPIVHNSQTLAITTSIPLHITSQIIQNTPITPTSSSVNGPTVIQTTQSLIVSGFVSLQTTSQSIQNTPITPASNSINGASLVQPKLSSTASSSTTVTSSSTSSSVYPVSSQQTTQTSSSMSSNSSTTTQSSLSNNLGSGSSSVWSFFSTKMLILSVLMMISIKKMFCRDA
ncbi:scavenger receptor cysteine-rich type 1 protein M130-like [Mytilus californianus]|uniref:scavenger receptor cysteine-rich type 1 protein M130-like n=1 Tax=Mytilus californianus TaxID=6549 RepID=UPI0022474650|nr:scavenger receptor cysteine-rich type 1 protein M130-like [Mytilus californianus]